MNNYEIEDYTVFIQNLRSIQRHYNYNNDWYNKIIEIVLFEDLETATAIVNLVNDVYCMIYERKP